MSVPHRAYVSAEKGNLSVDISPQRQKTTGMPGPPLPRRRAVCVFDLNQITGSRKAAMFHASNHQFVSPAGAMVDSFFWSIDWSTVAMAIGVMVSVIAAVFYLPPDGR